MNTTENKASGDNLWGWVIIVLVAALVAMWGLAAFVFVRDVPRTWNRGALPDTPSESIYSTSPAPVTATVPQQIHPLPEAKPKQTVTATASGGRS
jgi:hypothetical protein